MKKFNLIKKSFNFKIVHFINIKNTLTIKNIHYFINSISHLPIHNFEKYRDRYEICNSKSISLDIMSLNNQYHPLENKNNYETMFNDTDNRDREKTFAIMFATI